MRGRSCQLVFQWKTLNCWHRILEPIVANTFITVFSCASQFPPLTTLASLCFTVQEGFVSSDIFETCIVNKPSALSNWSNSIKSLITSYVQFQLHTHCGDYRETFSLQQVDVKNSLLLSNTMVHSEGQLTSWSNEPKHNFSGGEVRSGDTSFLHANVNTVWFYCVLKFLHLFILFFSEFSTHIWRNEAVIWL